MGNRAYTPTCNWGAILYPCLLVLMVGDISRIQAIPIDQAVPWDDVIFCWLSGSLGDDKAKIIARNLCYLQMCSWLMDGLEHF